MRAMVIGIKHIDFTPKGESKPIAGDKLQVVREFSMNEEGQGQMLIRFGLKLVLRFARKLRSGKNMSFVMILLAVAVQLWLISVL